MGSGGRGVMLASRNGRLFYIGCLRGPLRPAPKTLRSTDQVEGLSP